jgi:N-acetylglutamate synthase-like GNAT family acetyltransferase
VADERVLGTIRRARADEAGEITAIAMRSKAYWGYDEHVMEMFRPELVVTEDDIERDHLVVLEHDRRPAGFAHLRPQSHITLELVSFFIDTWAIRQGFGQRLWNYAVAYAREQRLQTVVLESDQRRVVLSPAGGGCEWD